MFKILFGKIRRIHLIGHLVSFRSNYYLKRYSNWKSISFIADAVHCKITWTSLLYSVDYAPIRQCLLMHTIYNSCKLYNDLINSANSN